MLHQACKCGSCLQLSVFLRARIVDNELGLPSFGLQRHLRCNFCLRQLSAAPIPVHQPVYLLITSVE